MAINSASHFIAVAGQGKSHRARISCEYLPQEASTQPELGNHSKHLPSIYFQAGNVLSTLHALTHLISATHPTCRHYYYPHFTDEETGPERGNNPYKVTVSGGRASGRGRSVNPLSTPIVQTYPLHTPSEKIHPILVSITGE